MDYRDFIKKIYNSIDLTDSILYLDPPYIESFKYADGENVNNFYQQLLKVYRHGSKFKRIIQSNFCNDDILKAYQDYKIIKIERKLNMQTSSAEERIKTELIIIKDNI